MSRFKKYIVSWLLYFGIVCLAFLIGTFVPNPITENQIIKRIELKIKSELFSLNFFEPEFNSNTELEFITSVIKCVDFLNFKIESSQRIPSELILAQTILESDYGKSRFSVEGNNILGIRTFNKEDPQMKSKANPNAKWGLRIFKTKCDCIHYYIRLLNNHKAYSEFRELRIKQHKLGEINAIELAKTLTNYATDEKYIEKLIEKIIEMQETKHSNSLGIRG
jgi:Bax protein